MPAGDTPIRGFEVFTQRASNESSRHDTDDADRRAFAALVDDARNTGAQPPTDTRQSRKPDSQPADQPSPPPTAPKDLASSDAPEVLSTETTATSQETGQASPAAPAPTVATPQSRPAPLLTHLLTQLQQHAPEAQTPAPATQQAIAPAAVAEQPVVAPLLATETAQPAQANTATTTAPVDPAAPQQQETAAALTANPAAAANALAAAPKQLAPTTPATPTSGDAPQAAQPSPAAPPAPEAGPGANRLAASLNAPAPAIEAGGAANPGSQNQTQSQAGTTQQPTAPASAANGAAAQKPASIGAPVVDAASPVSQSGTTQGSVLSISSTTPATSATAGQATSAPSTPAPPPALAGASPAVVQVYSRMVERFDGKAQQFQIRLDPPELGRVNVRIEIGADHRVHAVLAAHDSNALADLMRGQRALEQSLANAGIDLSEEGIRFELSDQNTNQSSRGDQDAAPEKRTQPWMLDADTSAAVEQAVAQQSRWSRSRINVVA